MSMDIRKILDTTNPYLVDLHLSREREYRQHLKATLPRGKQRDKLVAQSQRRCKHLQQAHEDWLFSDGRAELKYGKEDA